MNPDSHSPRRVRVVIAAVLVLFTVSVIHAQAPENPILVVEHWSELAPFTSGVSESPLPRELVLERLVTEAQVVLSGMVYGYRFVYTPSNPDRGVVEQFQMEPHAIIERGDPGFEVFQTWIDGDRLYARILYTMDRRQLDWFGGWQSSANSSASGMGTVPFLLGPTEKINALDDAVRIAIRNQLREEIRNRPRLVEGAALLRESPRFGVDAGNYTARVSVLLQIDEIEPYAVY